MQWRYAKVVLCVNIAALAEQVLSEGGKGCVVQVTTQQGDNVAEALVFVPDATIADIDGDKTNGRRLV